MILENMYYKKFWKGSKQFESSSKYWIIQEASPLIVSEFHSVL